MKNNPKIAVNVIYAKKKKERIYPVYILKHKSRHEKQVILLMNQDKEKWHYLLIKRLSLL